jgi:hypothetical protein
MADEIVDVTIIGADACGQASWLEGNKDHRED